MSIALEIQEFLTSLARPQGELAALFVEKDEALRRLRVDDLNRISLGEQELGQRLQGHLARRGQLLESARAQGLPGESLQQLAGALAPVDQNLLREQIRSSELQSGELRHASWVHWIVTQRSYNHFTELLELIAHGGHLAPTYSGRAQAPAGGTGGAILDASI